MGGQEEERGSGNRGTDPQPLLFVCGEEGKQESRWPPGMGVVACITPARGESILEARSGCAIAFQRYSAKGRTGVACAGTVATAPATCNCYPRSLQQGRQGKQLPRRPEPMPCDRSSPCCSASLSARSQLSCAGEAAGGSEARGGGGRCCLSGEGCAPAGQDLATPAHLFQHQKHSAGQAAGPGGDDDDAQHLQGSRAEVVLEACWAPPGVGVKKGPGRPALAPHNTARQPRHSPIDGPVAAPATHAASHAPPPNHPSQPRTCIPSCLPLPP